MAMELSRKTESVNEDNVPVILWKFIDENGDFWNTETPIDGTEEDARNIILNAIDNNNN